MGIFSSMLSKAQKYIDDNAEKVDPEEIGDDHLDAIAVAKYKGERPVLVHHFADGSVELSYGKADERILPRLFHTYVDKLHYTDAQITTINNRLISITKSARTSQDLATKLKNSGYFLGDWEAIDVTTPRPTTERRPSSRTVKYYDTLGAKYNILYNSTSKPFMIHVFSSGTLAISKGDGHKLPFSDIEDFVDAVQSVDAAAIKKLEDECQLATSTDNLIRRVKDLNMFTHGFLAIQEKPHYTGGVIAVYTHNGDINASKDNTFIIKRVLGSNVFDLVTVNDQATELDHNKLVDTSNTTEYNELKNVIENATDSKKLAKELNKLDNIRIKGWLPL